MLPSFGRGWIPSTIYLIALVYLLLIFVSARDLQSLEQLINTELKKVKLWRDASKLLINFSKTNFMIVKSPKEEKIGSEYQDRKWRRYEFFPAG